MISRLYVSAALVAAVCTLSAIPCGAADAQSLYQQAVKAQIGDPSKGVGVDLKTARALLEEAAAAGSAEAMQRLGDMYHDGDGGVAKDYAKAIEWYKKEAALDESQPGSGALGMVALAEMYASGRGVEADPAASDEWFAKALASAKTGADQGNSMAMTALAYCLAQGKGGGVRPDAVGAWAWAIKAGQHANPWAYELMASLYARGVGVKADPSKALNELLKAAQMGVSRDMVDVSLSFASGSGVKKDEKAAIDWIKKAVDHGNARAMGVLGRYYHEDIGVERSDLTAKEWFQKAIDLGDGTAMGYMGDMYIAPGVNPREATTAAAWFEKGVAEKDPYSMYKLAYLLSYDPDITQDVNRARELLTESAKLGYVDALAAIGELYRNGKLRGTLSDAIAIFQKAAEAGSIPGMRNLGEMLTIQADGANPYKTDDDDKELMGKAFDWLKKAADAGDVEAITDVGDHYLKGQGIPESASTAIKWYRKAATAGNVRAMRSLGLLFLSDNVVANFVEAKKWLEMGRDRGDAACAAGLAEMYDNALGVEEDNTKARDLYIEAMRGGAAGGYRGVAQYLAAAGDYRQAAAYYNEAVNLGDMRAMEALGRMYELGQGVEKNMGRAMQLFTRAQDMGSLSAWNWVFSHTDFSATRPSGLSGSAAPLLNVPDLTGNLNSGRGPGRGAGFGPGGGGGGFGPGGGGGGGGFGGGRGGGGGPGAGRGF